MQPTSSTMSTSPQAPIQRGTHWWWFLVPLLSFGLATFAAVLMGGLKLRSRPNLYAAAGYFVATVLLLCGTGLSDPEAETGMVFSLMMVSYMALVWLGGTLHTVLLQHEVARREPKPALPLPVGTDPAIAAAMWRAGRRAEARRLLQLNPVMAWELRIGRPDMADRHYDDGGLVDVNHLPAAWLLHSLHLPAALADQVVAARLARGGFGSADELVVYCQDVTVEMLDMIRDLLIFRPL